MGVKKRFTISSKNSQKICDNKEKKYYLSIDADALLKILNKLADENEQLKQREQTLLDEIEDFQELLTKLDNENEQLKKDLKKEFIPFARTDEDGITKVDTDTFIRILQENNQLKQQLANVERLIDDLGSEELRRQYEEIINGDVDD